MEQLGNYLQTREKKQNLPSSLKDISNENRTYWLSLWKNQQSFVVRCTPQNALKFLESPKLVWSSIYPTMSDIISLYPTPMYEWVQDSSGAWKQDTNRQLTSQEAVLRFLRLQLASYLLNCPQREAPTQSQLQEMTMQIYAVMKPYTIAEIMLFFAMLKSGCWKMYQKGNIQEICELFQHEFKDYRSIMIDQVNCEKKDKEEQERRARCVTHEQAKEMARKGLIPPLQNIDIIKKITQ